MRWHSKRQFRWSSEKAQDLSTPSTQTQQLCTNRKRATRRPKRCERKVEECIPTPSCCAGMAMWSRQIGARVHTNPRNNLRQSVARETQETDSCQLKLTASLHKRSMGQWKDCRRVKKTCATPPALNEYKCVTLPFRLTLIHNTCTRPWPRKKCFLWQTHCLSVACFGRAATRVPVAH